MPVCQYCHNQWTYMETLKNTFRFICPYCNNKSFLSAKTRKRGGYIYIIILPLIILNIYFDVSLVVGALIALLLIVAHMLINPFFVKLSKEEEPLW